MCRRCVIAVAVAHGSTPACCPDLQRARSVEERIAWLYLKGVSTGDYQEALSALRGEGATGLSANTVWRLGQQRSEEHRTGSGCTLSDGRYVDWWADGV